MNKGTCDIPRKVIITEALVEYIKKNCVVDEADGQLYCNNCGHRVVVDFFEQQLECLGCDEL